MKIELILMEIKYNEKQICAFMAKVTVISLGECVEFHYLPIKMTAGKFII